MKIRSTATHRVNYTTQLPIVGEVTFDENREIEVADDLATELLALEGLELVDAAKADAEVKEEEEQVELAFEELTLAAMKEVAIQAGLPAEEVAKIKSKEKMVVLFNSLVK
jgi:hypothetical protein